MLLLQRFQALYVMDTFVTCTVQPRVGWIPGQPS